MYFLLYRYWVYLIYILIFRGATWERNWVLSHFVKKLKIKQGYWLSGWECFFFFLCDFYEQYSLIFKKEKKVSMVRMWILLPFIVIIIPKLIRVVLLLSGSNNKSLPHVGSSTLLIVLSTIMIFSINVFIYNICMVLDHQY